MLNKDKVLYSLSDVAIMPAEISYIEHRGECDPYYSDGYLPIFTAPMPCVVDKNNFHKFDDEGIIPILPRTEDIYYRIGMCQYYWCAFSLDEFENYFATQVTEEKPKYENTCHVLIDVANGNMDRLFKACEVAKKISGKGIELMVGNIANPETYRRFCEIGVDYVRCSIGSGAGCTTATCLGLLYPMASLIDECHQIKVANNYHTKIVADGGLSSYRRMMKALALGADYVMLGSVLNKLEDSAGEMIEKLDLDKEKGRLVPTKFKEFYGMASEKGMKMLGKTGVPEGKIIYNRCEGTIKSFCNEFKGLLRSVMSYCNKTKLEDFVGGVELNILSENASNQFNQTK